ncbi:MAG: transposase [Thermoanaerobaculia bacterium]
MFTDGVGRPSIPPGTYFRMMFAGFFEGLSSERAIARRCADSFSRREFLGVGLTEVTPDHSTLSGGGPNRQRPPSPSLSPDGRRGDEGLRPLPAGKMWGEGPASGAFPVTA